jgi:hypothetical protein
MGQCHVLRCHVFQCHGQWTTEDRRLTADDRQWTMVNFWQSMVAVITIPTSMCEPMKDPRLE